MMNWHKFASLGWYDQFIEFLFRFAAKTSEPLLAIGIAYSAADILSKGNLGYNNPTISNLWAITQALAIESSGGVVLVYGLQSLKEKDTLKASLYLVLSGLLALAGGVMLFMQLAGWENSQGNTPFMLSLFALRCVVSVGYIYLCRTKHLRFTGIAIETASVSPETPSSISEDVMNTILAKLEKLDLLEQAIAAHSIVVSEVQEQLLALPVSVSETSETESDTASLQAQIEGLLLDSPTLSSREIAERLQRPHSTVYRHMSKVKQQMKQSA
jgi:DNA-directed RNA polymerase specialized sigma24 family protein